MSSNAWYSNSAYVSPSPESVLDRLRALPNVIGGAILTQHEAGVMRCAASFGMAPSVGTPLNRDSQLSAEALSYLKSVTVADTSRDGRTIGLPEQLRSLLIVPIVDREQPIGLVQLYSSKTFGFSGDDIRAIEHLAATLAPQQPQPAPVIIEQPSPEEEDDDELIIHVLPSAPAGIPRPVAMGGVIVVTLIISTIFIFSRTHVTSAAVRQPIVMSRSGETGSANFEDLPQSDSALPSSSASIVRRSSGGGTASAGHAAAAAPSKTELPIELSKSASKIVPIYADNAASLPDAVELSAVINPDGSVEEVHAKKGPEELRASAEAAVKQWKYRPEPEPRILTVRVRQLP